MLDESDNAGGVLFPSSVSISPLGRVAEEGGVANVVFALPVPVTGVPLEFGDETELKNPVDRGFFPGGGEALGQFEGSSVAFLLKNSDRLVPSKRDDDVMRAGRFDTARA